jgi:hypothetical protein
LNQLFFAGHTRQHAVDFIGRERPVTLAKPTKLLKNLGRLRDGLLVPFDIDGVVATSDGNAQSVADFSQMLVTRSEEGEECLRIDYIRPPLGNDGFYPRSIPNSSIRGTVRPDVRAEIVIGQRFAQYAYLPKSNQYRTR